MKILVLNCGSSSLKYQLIDMEKENVMAKGYYERIGSELSFLNHKVNGEKYHIEEVALNHDDAIKVVLAQFTHPDYGVISSLNEISAIGHRVVHGGEKFKCSVLINETVIKDIAECGELAPLHTPPILAGIRACEKVMPGKKMVAVFDTAFHATMPKEHYLYQIPYKYYDKYKVRKYGFHGTSHKYIAKRIAEVLGRNDLKVVNCHLGQGASLCAIKDGKSLDTSMGFTPTSGIPMGTRAGDIDPTIPLFIIKKENISAEETEKILNKESGILGISEISPDFRDVEAAYGKGDEKAKVGLENYAYLVAQYVARYAVTLGGIDVITFTAGVGENSSLMREKICNYLKFLGVELDLEKNNVRSEEREISTPNSKIKVYIIPTDEEMMIAKETMELVK